MARWRIIDASRTDAAAQLRVLRRPLLLEGLVLDDGPECRTVREIIADVRQRGDDAVSDITARVDGARVPPEAVRVPPERIRQAWSDMTPELRSAVQGAIDSLTRFQRHILPDAPPPLRERGRTLEMRPTPLNRVGICVPGAAAPLLSSVIHCAVPARVAGVPELAVIAPPRHRGPDGSFDVHPAILGVAGALGIDEVYRMGGAHGVAALALGTPRVRRVDKIVGPGGVYVQLAKRLLYGVADIDMFAATTEVVIIADDSARPSFLAADMLAQAEHNPGCSILLTDAPGLPEQVCGEIERLLGTLSTAEAAARWLEEYGAMVVVRDLDQAVALADEIAPEHLEIETRRPRELAARIRHAGAIFLGHYSPESAGDYVAGPSHVLPTGGTARFWSGVSALSFLRYTSITEYDRTGLAADAGAIDRLARAEGLEAHARSATCRVEEAG